MDSPTGLLLCLGAYFVVVALGCALQSGRPPVAPEAKRPDPAWLRALVLAHNLFLVALSLFMSGGCASAIRATAPAIKRASGCIALPTAPPAALCPHASRLC